MSSPADAEDLVQEVFAKLARLTNPGDVNNPAAYVFSVAANLLRDRARRAESHRAKAHEPFDEESHGHRTVFSPERLLMSREDLEMTRRVIQSLPKKTQTVFLLHRFDGLKYREIAEVLELSVSTVEKHMIAALAALARRIKDKES